MKFIFTLLIITLYSCHQENKQDTRTKYSVSDTSKASPSSDSNTLVPENISESTDLGFEKRQDSLRAEILKHKGNKMLKQSFLEELYIRNVVHVSKDILFAKISFNLHVPDCGAPDCYTTDISFNFKLGDSLIFPDSLIIKEHEHGCVDKESKLTGKFHLVEKTNALIIYHCEKYKRTLVLFSSNKENGTAAYYFTGVNKNKINAKNMIDITK